MRCLPWARAPAHRTCAPQRLQHAAGARPTRAARRGLLPLAASRRAAASDDDRGSISNSSSSSRGLNVQREPADGVDGNATDDSSDDDYLEPLPAGVVGDNEDEGVEGEDSDDDSTKHATGQVRISRPAPGSALSQELHRMVAASDTAPQLLTIMQRHGAHASDHVIAAAFQQLAKLVATGPRQEHSPAGGVAAEREPSGAASSRGGQADGMVAAVALLEWLQQPLASCAHTMELRSLAHIVWACSKLHWSPLLAKRVDQTLEVVVMQLLQRGAAAQKAAPRTQSTVLKVTSMPLVSKLLHDLALLGVDTEDKKRVFVWLLDSVVPLLPQARPQELSSCAFALAMAGSGLGRRQAVWQLVCKEATRQLVAPETALLFNSHSLDHLALAAARMGLASCPDGLVPALQACIKGLPISRPASTAAALGAAIRVGVTDEDRWFSNRARDVAALVPSMSVQHLGLTLWAYTKAQARQCDVLLDEAVKNLRERPAWSFRGKAQAIVQVLCALAKHNRKDAEIFVTLQREARGCLDSLSDVEQGMLLSAVSKLLDRMSEKDTSRYLELVDQELVSTLLTKHIEPRISTMDASEVTRVARSLMQLSWLDAHVNGAVVRRASEVLGSLNLQQVSVLLQWLAKVVVVEAEDGAGRSQASAVGRQHLPQLSPMAARLKSELLDRTMELLKHAGRPTRVVSTILWSAALLEPDDAYNIRYLLLQVAAYHGQGEDRRGLNTTITQVMLATVLLGRPLHIKSSNLQAFVRRAMHEYQEDLCRNTKPSATQLQVCAELVHVEGVTAVELEVPVCGGLLSVDVMVRYRGHDICIEVDGPFHYMLNRQDLVAGDTLFRRRILAACGYRVLSVRATEFAAPGTIQGRIRMLEDLLKMAMQSPQQLALREKAMGRRKDKLHTSTAAAEAQGKAATQLTLEAAEFASSDQWQRTRRRQLRRHPS